MVEETKIIGGLQYTLADTANTPKMRDEAKAIVKPLYRSVRVVTLKGMSKKYPKKYAIYVRGKKPRRMPRPAGIPAPKYKVGDMVYSWQNPTVKRSVTYVRESREPGFQHQYKVSLRDKEGYSYSSKYMGEKSLSKRRKKAY